LTVEIKTVDALIFDIGVGNDDGRNACVECQSGDIDSGIWEKGLKCLNVNILLFNFCRKCENSAQGQINEKLFFIFLILHIDLHFRKAGIICGVFYVKLKFIFKLYLASRREIVGK
jgi:hypothetical protein